MRWWLGAGKGDFVADFRDAPAEGRLGRDYRGAAVNGWFTRISGPPPDRPCWRAAREVARQHGHAGENAGGRRERHGVARSTPKSSVSSRRVKPRAPPKPRSRPTRSEHPAAQNQPQDVAVVAPSAARIPISCVRCATE